MWNQVRDALIYRPLAFAETAESIDLARRALRVGPGESVAGITSSGDILLSLLADRPSAIHGFDVNPAQTAVAELKRVLCECATLDEATGFLGVAHHSGPDRLRYWRRIAPLLGDSAGVVAKFDIADGLLNCGMTRRLIRGVCLAFRVCLGREDYQRLVGEDATAQERLELHRNLGQCAAYRLAIRPVLHAGNRVFQHFFFPPGLCANSDYPRRALRDLLANFRRLFEVGLGDNPVFCRHISGRTHREHVDHLYSPAAWSRLHEHASTARFQTATLHGGLGRLAPRSIDAFYLSNAPDYMRPDSLLELSRELQRVARPGARIYYLSLEPSCAFERNDVQITSKRCFNVENDLVHADPVGLYPFIGVRIHE